MGAMAHRAALPPVLPFGFHQHEHFELIRGIAFYPTPFEVPPRRLISICAILQRDPLVRGELKRRWAVVDACLRARQPAPIRQVFKQRDITLFILLCLLVSWGDPTFPKDFLFGMATVGTAPWYGEFPRQASRNISIEDVLLDAAASNAQIRASLRSSKDASFLLEQSVKDVENGFCTQPFRHSELLHMVKGQLFRLIPI